MAATWFHIFQDLRQAGCSFESSKLHPFDINYILVCLAIHVVRSTTAVLSHRARLAGGTSSCIYTLGVEEISCLRRSFFQGEL